MFNLYSTLVFCLTLISISLSAQNPGGVSTQHTTWFKSNSQVFQDAGMTIPAVDGGPVGAMGNIKAIAGTPIPSVTRSAGTITYSASDEYLNFNPGLDFTSSTLQKFTLDFDDIFSSSQGSTIILVSIGGADISFTFTSTLAQSPCNSNRCCTGFRTNNAMFSGVSSNPYSVSRASNNAFIASSFTDYNNKKATAENGYTNNSTTGSPFQEYSGAKYDYNIFLL